ncbi:hypothetical protein PENSPDRAFT_37042 [Peniophora sp. CONT]|nr:hypothetical protein PENSPDRAFT_37042 [Peniophora sp. CONT]
MTRPSTHEYTLLPLYSSSPTSSASPPPYAHGIAQAENIGLHSDPVKDDASIPGTLGLINSRGEASGNAQGSTPTDAAAGTAASLPIEARLSRMTFRAPRARHPRSLSLWRCGQGSCCWPLCGLQNGWMQCGNTRVCALP